MRSFQVASVWLALVFSSLSLTRACCAESPDGFRLPTSVRPEHYDVSLIPDSALATFRGDARVDLVVLRQTTKIVLNAVELTFERAQIAERAGGPGVRDGNVQQTADIVLDGQHENATLTFAKPLPPGRYSLDIGYRGRINATAQGLFALTYKDERGPQKMLATQLEASDARRLIPCWDEPSLKATFSLSVTAPEEWLAISNMPVAESQILAGGQRRTRFQATPRMSTYLLFLGLGDFERKEIEVAGTKLGVVTRRGALDEAQFALDAASGLLPYYADYFGVPYALPKLDLFAAPGVGEFGFHAMENWGAILYFEDAMLVDPGLSTTADRQKIFTYIAHEMAHQWFGNLVTMEWWDDLWLNEAFAEWMENKAADQFHPEWRMWLQTEDARQLAMREDAMRTTHPIVRRVITPNQISFDNITYDKGQAVIRMLEGYVGADPFRDGVRRYIRKFAWGNARTQDLLGQLEAAAGKPITPVARDFIEQPGVPLVTAEADRCRAGQASVMLSQRRLALDAASHRRTEWRIPVVAAGVETNAQARMLLAAERGRISVAGCQPVKINAGQTGYFRSVYAADSFASLAARFAALQPADQLGLLYDSWALGEAEVTPVERFLDLVRRLKPDAEPAVWRGVVRILGKLDALYRGLPEQTRFRDAARAMLGPLMAKVSWDAESGEADNVAVLREDLLGLLGQLEDPDAVAEARRRFDRLLRDPAALSPVVLRATLEIVGQNADAAAYDQLVGLAARARSSTERQQIVDALAGARNSELVARTLDAAMAPNVPPATTLSMIKHVANDNPDMAWQFALSHWDGLKDRLAAEQRFEFVPSLAALSDERARLPELRRFIDQRVPSDARPLAEKSYAELAFRLQVRERVVPKISEWLTRAPAR